MNKLLLSTVLGVFFLVFAKNAIAADLTVDCDDSGCSPATASTIFPSDSWYPGRSVSRNIQINNTGANGLTISNKAQSSTVTGNLDQVMHFSILRSSDNLVIWSGTLNNFYSAGDISLGSLSTGTNNSFNYTMTMNSTAGNGYQSKSTAYNLVLTFTGGSSDGGSSSGSSVAGASTGGGVSCNDTKPGSAPTLISAVAGTNSVTLFWNKASGAVTYYLVSYRTAGGAQYGNPNVGGSSTTSYTVGGLSGGTTYYFKVRAGNGCMPGDYSEEKATIPTGVFIATPAEGFTQGVLGTQDNINSGAATASPEIVNVLGTQTSWWQKYWWILPLILFGGLLLWWFLGKMRGNENH